MTPRWRCADPNCPKHRWQPVTTHGEYDPIDAALGELEAHWAKDHKDKTKTRKGKPDAVGA